MYDLLKGLRVIDVSAFVAGPTCGLYLAQMGAEVIRVDTIGGGPDFGRWPLAPNGARPYWGGREGCRPVAARRERRQPLLGGAEQGQEVGGDRPGPARGPRAGPAAGRRA